MEEGTNREDFRKRDVSMSSKLSSYPPPYIRTLQRPESSSNPAFRFLNPSRPSPSDLSPTSKPIDSSSSSDIATNTSNLTIATPPPRPKIPARSGGKQTSNITSSEKDRNLESSTLLNSKIILLQTVIRYWLLKNRFLRQRILLRMEIISTEKTYLQSLRLLVQHFEKPLREEHVISESDIGKIFSNLSALTECSSQLLVKLLSREIYQSQGQIFCEMAPVFNLYSQFVNNFDISTNLLKSYRELPTFNAFMKRYTLLLAEIRKNTPKDSTELPLLSMAISRMQKVAEGLNEMKRQTDTLQKIVDIQSSIDPPNFLKLVESHRKFIREGRLLKLWGQGIDEFHFFLFNDILLYCYPPRMNSTKYRYISFFIFDKSELQDTSSLNYPHTFSIHYPAWNKKFGLAARTAQEKKEWMSSLSKLISDHKSSESIKVAPGSDVFQASKMKGYLKKQGSKVKSWKRRYFRLKGTTLYYYEDKDTAAPINHLVLKDDNTSFYRLDIHPSNLQIDLISEKRRSLYIIAENINCFTLWIRALESFVMLSHRAVSFLEGSGSSDVTPSSSPRSLDESSNNNSVSSSFKTFLSKSSSAISSDVKDNPRFIPSFSEGGDDMDKKEELQDRKGILQRFIKKKP